MESSHVITATGAKQLSRQPGYETCRVLAVRHAGLDQLTAADSMLATRQPGYNLLMTHRLGHHARGRANERTVIFT